ncbi:hypothetical protein GCM10020254_16790 [Streptomyces goshikiensis]
MRILVLGRTGYLGAHVADRLRALPGARVFDGGRSPDADFGVDLAADPPDRLAAVPPPRHPTRWSTARAPPEGTP